MRVSVCAVALLSIAVGCVGGVCPCGAQDLSFPIGGGVNATVRSPAGFSPSEEGRILLEKVAVPPQGRLLAAYLSNDDIAKIQRHEKPAMQRYMLLQTAKFAESQAVTPDMFAEFRELVSAQQEKLISDKQISDLFRQSSDRLSDATGKDVSLRLGQITSLGVFDRRADVFSWGLLAPLTADVEGTSVSLVIVGSVSAVHVKSKILFVYVYARLNSQADIDWTKKTITEWVNIIIAANRGAGEIDSDQHMVSSALNLTATLPSSPAIPACTARSWASAVPLSSTNPALGDSGANPR